MELVFATSSCDLENPLKHRFPIPEPIPVHGLLRNGWHSGRWAAGCEGSFISIYSHFPLFALLPELCLWSDQWWHQVLIGVQTLLWTVCAEGSRLPAPYENLMPDDLRWSWGGDASAERQLQIQIIISKGLQRDHNKSITCRLITKALSVSAKWQLSCIWWQALSQNLTHFSLFMACPLFYLPLHPCLFPTLCTCLSHSFG